MAGRIGLCGEPNSGKSYAGKTIKKGEEWFIISPNEKKTYIKLSNGELLPYFNLRTDKTPNTNEICKNLDIEVTHDLGVIIAGFTKKKLPLDSLILEGNKATVKDISQVDAIMRLISDRRPDIKYILLPDFTHYLNIVMSSKKFLSRNSGGEAFARFWDMAADTLNNVIQNIDYLRRDLIVVTEYHSEYNEEAGIYEIFTTGGKMLKEKFKLESYYDYLFFTKYEDNEKVKMENRYKFITKRDGKYSARSSDLFKEVSIPNDLELVVNKVREDLGI